MCNVCGIVSEKFRPQSSYWEKMCGYITKSKVITTEGCVASGTGDIFTKVIQGEKYFAIVEGEIHNYKILKNKLMAKGVVCETENYAELVLMCYYFLGKSSFKLLKGEFCTIVWDGCTKELLMIRDKVGMNTMFYYFDGLRLAYASQIKGILQVPFVKKELCADIYCRLLSLAGSRGCGETMFFNIHEVPPGCYVRYKACKIEVISYYTFLVKDFSVASRQTESKLAYMLKNTDDYKTLAEKTMTKYQMMDNIERFVQLSDFPSPYVDLKTLSNIGAEDEFFDFTGVFNAPERFKLPSKYCRKQDSEFVSDFLSTLPWFEYKDENDISKKEDVYIKQFIVIPQVVYARKKLCKNIKFPFLDEEVVEYNLQNLAYINNNVKQVDKSQYDKNNLKNVKALFNEMISDENMMSGIIDREEVLKFTRLFPRPETMLYFLQVDIWLDKYL